MTNAWTRATDMIEGVKHGPATPSELALVASRGRWHRAPHLDVIETACLNAIDGATGVTLSAAVRHGKSEYASKWLPAWFLGTNPDKRVILATHEARFARNWGRQVRNILAEYGPEMFGVEPARDNAAANEWGIEGHDGGMLTVGVGGAPIGRGADLCIASGTLVETPQGAQEIDTLADRGGTLWAYDHERKSVVEAIITGATESIAPELVEVQFTSGRTIRCTPDHPIYVNGHGYTEAGNLTAGATVTTTRGTRMPTLRNQVQADAERRRSVTTQRRGHVLQPSVWIAPPRRTATRDPETSQAGDRAMRLLREGRPHARMVLGKEATPRTDDRLLRRQMLRQGATATAEMRTVRGADGEEGTPVLSRLHHDPQARDHDCARRRDVSDVRDDIPPQQSRHRLLLPRMREPGTRGPNGGPGELELQGRDELRPLVQVDAAAHHGTGRRLRRVWVHGEADDPPRERGPRRQPTGEPRPALPDAPHHSPQVGTDTVHVVRRIRGTGHLVYDLEVEGQHNFFAGEVLVHNCIVDDPLKSWEAAMSPLQRERVIDWWTGTMESRREPGAAVVVICARWHEDDLTGYLLREAPDEWTDIRLPAICDDPENDPLGRAEGEALWPERYPVDELAKRRSAVSLSQGSQVWDAQYQQRPTSPEGGMFGAEWPTIQRHIVDARSTGEWVRGWDLAATAAGGDWTVGVLATKLNDGRFVIVDRVAGQWAPDDVRAQLVGCATQDPPGTRVVLPQDPGQAGKDQAQQLIRLLAGYDVRAEPQTGSKETRAAGLAAQQRAENVLLVEGSWNRAFITELAGFPRAKHDDQVDAAATAFNALNSAVCSVAQVSYYAGRLGR